MEALQHWCRRKAFDLWLGGMLFCFAVSSGSFFSFLIWEKRFGWVWVALALAFGLASVWISKLAPNRLLQRVFQQGPNAQQHLETILED